MGVAMPFLAVASAAMSAVGQVEQGAATAANDRYQAQVAANNAIVAKQNETYTINSGEATAANQGMKTRARVGTEKASQGASGVDVNTGSPVAVRAGTESLGMLDALTIRSDSARRAYGYEVAASNDTAQSQLDTQAAGQAETGADIGAIGGLLSNASTIGSKYGNFLASGSGSSVGDPLQLAGAVT